MIPEQDIRSSHSTKLCFSLNFKIVLLFPQLLFLFYKIIHGTVHIISQKIHFNNNIHLTNNPVKWDDLK